jgi:hypothetical protein
VSRRHWQHLPKTVRAAVEAHTGPVLQVQPVNAGFVSEIAAILHTATGDLFCKGITAANPRAWMHRREALVNSHVQDFAPRLRWQVDQDGWVLLGFDRAHGRHLNGAPESADLPTLAETLTAISAVAAPRIHRFQPAGARWGQWLDPALVDGDTLVHADANLKNYLIDDGRITVVDWATPCRGTPWLDTALMAIRLIHAGHSPAAAARWAEQVPAWRAAAPEAVRAFATACAALGAQHARQSTAPHLRQLADAADEWAQFLTSGRPAANSTP